jgi:hypothetical protein
VEINYTFRRLPSASTLENWVAQTAPGFVFAVKANMRITHILRLKNAAEATELFLKMIDPLRSARRLGPILFQLPPAMKCDVALLRATWNCCPPTCATPSNSATQAGWWRKCTTTRRGAQRVAVRGGIGEAGSAAGDHRGFRLLPPAQARVHGGRCRSGIVTRAKEVLATGRDLYLMFKHEESPEGALHAETVLKRRSHDRSGLGFRLWRQGVDSIISDRLLSVSHRSVGRTFAVRRLYRDPEWV